MHQSSRMRSTTVGFHTIISIKYVGLTAVETCTGLGWCICRKVRQQNNEECPSFSQSVIDFSLLSENVKQYEIQGSCRILFQCETS